MRSLALLIVSACWSGSVGPAPTIGVASRELTGTCTIRDAKAVPMSPIKLLVGGESFAELTEEIRVDVTIRGGDPAHTRIETDQLVLDGKYVLDLDAFHIRPRDRGKLHDGWLDVQTARVVSAIGASARLDVPLPEGLVPRSIEISRSCSALTIAAVVDEEAPDGDEVIFTRATPLLRTAGGTAVARVVLGDNHVIATVLERDRDYLRVSLRGPNEAIGWVIASATLAPGGGGGGFGYGTSGHTQRKLSCPETVPLYVRSGSGEVVRVGHLKKDELILPAVDPKSGVDEVGIKLGGTLVPFLRVTDLADCSY